MPELPEVETTRRGISPHLVGQCIEKVIIREHRLRWPINKNLVRTLVGLTISEVDRRGKYLLLYTKKNINDERCAGCLILHLGMSGSLRVLPAETSAIKHDHVDIILNNLHCLRYRDPRRFGAILWTQKDPLQHKLLSKLGLEPLDNEFDGEYLFTKSRGRSIAVKTFIMNSHILVGAGNIYANEALFCAGIRPTRAAGRISKKRYISLAIAIREVLRRAISAGGTTLRDFTASDGQPGYFKQELKVYGKNKEPCVICGNAIKCVQLAQRATYFCPHCQR